MFIIENGYEAGGNKLQKRDLDANRFGVARLLGAVFLYDEDRHLWDSAGAIDESLHAGESIPKEKGASADAAD